MDCEEKWQGALASGEAGTFSCRLPSSTKPLDLFSPRSRPLFQAAPPRRAAPLRCLKICGASMVCSLCLESFFLPAFCAALAARARARRGALARRACFPALLSVLLLYRDL